MANQNEDTVAQVIGIQSSLDALQRISLGSANPDDYSIIGDDWTVADRANELLHRFDLDNLSLKQSIASLSSGERTRLSLLRVFISDADFILLDEPTNNLDKHARETLYNEISKFQGGLIQDASLNVSCNLV